ncbi:unnamed protein product [Lepeophtheirus salmonis]|uniref:(salmon louse) hypothetical protein n=1 Tax=Lepeophtheirus salmonis TaxID=72036 RepID=A0A7R8H6W2_LEPSM|nr:unnamed protein product [Lepeophtheirus salmonis]CAF2911222.1 unnamed protein product [Lepeophtheirus salmonis]
MFAKSFADDMKDLYPLIGPDAINYFSNDDTARVPLGLGAENLQAPILIRVLYIKVRLPDYYFVAVTRRSQKWKIYYSSTAFTHAFDLRNLFILGSKNENLFWLLKLMGVRMRLR